jgi:hypothetical protein
LKNRTGDLLDCFGRIDKANTATVSQSERR